MQSLLLAFYRGSKWVSCLSLSVIGRLNHQIDCALAFCCLPASPFVCIWCLCSSDRLLSVFCCATGCRWSSTKAFLIGFVVTFFPLFDVPVFWPILLLYWFILAFITMKRQIKHMIKYRYVPFSWGKKVSPALQQTSQLSIVVQVMG